MDGEKTNFKGSVEYDLFRSEGCYKLLNEYHIVSMLSMDSNSTQFLIKRKQDDKLFVLKAISYALDPTILEHTPTPLLCHELGKIVQIVRTERFIYAVLEPPFEFNKKIV